MKIGTVVGIFALVAAAQGAPANRARGINEALVDFFEGLKEKLQQGFPALGIPPLDPAFIPHAAINVDASMAQLQGSQDSTTVVGISAYTINSVEMHLLTMTMNFDFLFTTIDVTGENYEITGTLANEPISGTGPFQMTIHDLSMVGEVRMGMVNGSVQIVEMPVEMTFPTLTCNFEGLNGGGASGEAANQLLMELAPAIFDEVKGPFLEKLLKPLLDLLNSSLEGLTFDELIDIILGIGGNDFL